MVQRAWLRTRKRFRSLPPGAHGVVCRRDGWLFWEVAQCWGVVDPCFDHDGVVCDACNRVLANQN